MPVPLSMAGLKICMGTSARNKLKTRKRLREQPHGIPHGIPVPTGTEGELDRDFDKGLERQDKGEWPHDDRGQGLSL